jgi:GTP cyclohydrolase II
MHRPELVAASLESLNPRQVTDYITVYGGHHFRTVSRGVSLSLWAEEVRVRDERSGRSMMYRLITRDGIQNLQSRHLSPAVVIDNVPNAEAELRGGLYDTTKLSEAYERLISGEVDCILKPVREGSLGPTEEVGGYGPFREERSLMSWDTQEEVIFAHAIVSALQNPGAMTELKKCKEEIDQDYLLFALPLITHLNASYAQLHQTINDQWLTSVDIDSQFSELQPKQIQVDLGAGEVTVEQLVAYPYVTAQGALYIRLFRVWDEVHKTYESVRVIQTQPKGWADQNHYDGMRIDSGCHDGMHSRDCHCDCHQQLLEVIEEGQRKQEDRVVVQLMDHEGKGWGTVWKGATLRIMRNYNDQAGLTGDKYIGNPQAAAALYNALGEPHDRRDYRAAQAVIRALAISHVDTLLMGNDEKVLAVSAAGVQFNNRLAVEVEEVSQEAVVGLTEKKSGQIVIGQNGKVRYDS